jgi:hypothetical protein
MLYLFTGSDANKARSKAFVWVAAARAKAPDAYYLRLEPSAVTEESLRDALGAQGLFFSKTLVLIDDPFEQKEAGEAVLALLEELASSPNAVALLAPKLLAARLKKIEPHATKVFTENAVAKPARGFNSSLVNALAQRNGRALWKEVIKAQRAGDAPEMVHGLLHWKARDLIQKGGSGWSARDARLLSRDLIDLLTDSRGRDIELPLALERFALSLNN